MRPTTSTASRLLPVTLAAVVAAIMLGLLGMHALNPHPVMGGPMMGHPSGAVGGAMVGNSNVEELTVFSHHPVEAIGGMVGDPASDTAADGAAGPSGGSDHSMGDMLMLCVFMLAAAGALLLAFTGLHRTPRPHTTSRPRSGISLRPPSLRADARPPPEWEFSVVRC